MALTPTQNLNSHGGIANSGNGGRNMAIEFPTIVLSPIGEHSPQGEHSHQNGSSSFSSIQQTVIAPMQEVHYNDGALQQVIPHPHNAGQRPVSPSPYVGVVNSMPSNVGVINNNVPVPTTVWLQPQSPRPDGRRTPVRGFVISGSGSGQ
ncbi:hypothetical protein FACS1894152_7820 [Bacilli bacterium]|nr:hypothetical protein FACS1894152_7820 [Bacilli bacterium]